MIIQNKDLSSPSSLKLHLTRLGRLWEKEGARILTEALAAVQIKANPQLGLFFGESAESKGHVCIVSVHAN